MLSTRDFGAQHRIFVCGVEIGAISGMLEEYTLSNGWQQRAVLQNMSDHLPLLCSAIFK